VPRASVRGTDRVRRPGWGAEPRDRRPGPLLL